MILATYTPPPRTAPRWVLVAVVAIVAAALTGCGPQIIKPEGATAYELCTLPSVSPAARERVIRERERRGIPEHVCWQMQAQAANNAVQVKAAAQHRAAVVGAALISRPTFYPVPRR